jgi:hypothetical protein
LNTWPGQSPTNCGTVTTLPSRPLPDESGTAAPPSSSNVYHDTFPPPSVPPPGAVMSCWISAGVRAWSKMLKSSTVPLRNGSAYWDRPIQLLVVLPMLDGVSVMFGFVPAAWPLT